MNLCSRTICGLVLFAGAVLPAETATRSTSTELAPGGIQAFADSAWQPATRSQGSASFHASAHPMRPRVELGDSVTLSVELGGGSLSMTGVGLTAGDATLALATDAPTGQIGRTQQGRNRSRRDPVSPTSARELRVQDSWLGVDELFTLLDDGVKHDLLVSRAALDRLGDGDLHAAFALKLPAGHSIRIEPAGAMLRDSRDEFVARIPQPVILDSRSGHPARTTGRLELRNEYGKQFLDIITPSSWLRDPARVFPIRIDPTISRKPTANNKTGFVDELGARQDGAIDSGSLAQVGFGRDARGFAEFDTSAIPDGVTITDVRLQVWVSNHDNVNNPAVPLPMQIKEVTTRVNIGAGPLHNAIGSGANYVATDIPRTGPDFCPGSFVFRNFDLGNRANSTLQAQLPNDFFTVGFTSQVRDDPDFDHIDYIGYPESVANPSCTTQSFPGTRITLVVTYEENRPPVCRAGGPYTGKCTDDPISLDGRSSSDPDGDPLSYAWSTNCPGSLTRSDKSVATLQLPSRCNVGCNVTLTVSDGQEQSTCSATVNVRDNVRPTLTGVPADRTVECDAVPPVANPTVGDNCDPNPTLTYLGETRTDGTCADGYTLVRTWRATDRCGNSREKSQTITVRDTTPPSLSGPADQTVSCEDVPAVEDVVVTDNCDPDPDVTYLGETRVDGSCPDSYTLTRRWRASDRCGNEVELTQVLTVVDDTPPALSVPSDQTVSCDAVPPVEDVTVTDNCDPNPDVTYLGETRVDGNCPDSYTLTRTWRAADRCGNDVELTQTINVVDTSPPSLTVPADATVECDAIPALGDATATDDCDPDPDVVYVGEVRTDGSCPDSYTLTRTWRATDRCGNVREVAQTISVEDTQPPALTGVPADDTVECDAVPAPADPSATDNCDSDPIIAFVETRTDGSCDDGYVLTRNWTATDACGNQSTETQVLTVRDTQAPTLADIPPDETVECDAIPAPGTPTATDNCDPAPAVTYVGEIRTDGRCPDTYTLTRTWRATDRCGNVSEAEQVIAVQDTRAPTLSGVPANVTVECDAVPAPASPTASDNCDAAPAITFVETRIDGACDDSYTLVREWTATDGCGNATTESQTIVVRDTTPPVFAGIPIDVTVECDTVPAPATPTATDNCANPTIVFSEIRTDGSCEDQYTLVRSWTATDDCGNATTRSQTITVQDTTLPELHDVPADATVECDAVPPPAPVSATDNCHPNPDLRFSETRTDGPCDDSYTLLRVWTATDRCGHVTVAEQTLTVVDTQPPTFAGVPADTTVECDAVPPHADPTATDNCDPAPTIAFLETRVDGTCTDDYTLLREWTAIDRCGNETTTVQTVTVVDTTGPEILGVPPDQTVECDAVPPRPSPTTSDNCDPAPNLTVVETRVDGRCEDNYQLIYDWTATDRCGNTTLASHVLTVEDTTEPDVLGVLEPVPPLSPSSAASPRSVCSPPSSREFKVLCDTVDNCDPAPSLEANLIVTNHAVDDLGMCVPVVEEILVDCDEIVEIRLAAAPCPARSPQSSRPALSVNSDGIKIVTGESVVLEVRSQDRCGNEGRVAYDPAEEPSPTCEEVLEDGTCCPSIGRPPAPACDMPVCVDTPAPFGDPHARYPARRSQVGARGSPRAPLAFPTDLKGHPYYK